MEKFFRLITDQKWLVLVLFLALTMVLGYGMTKLEIRSILEGELPEDDFIVRTNNEFQQVFGDKSYVTFAFIHPQGLINHQSLQKLKDFSQALRTFPGVNKEQIISLATVTQVENNADGLIIEPFLQTVPQTEQQLADFEQLLRNNPLVWQRLISADLTTTLVSAPVDKLTPEDQVYQAGLALLEQWQGPETVYFYSFQVVNQAIDEGINRDTSVLFPLAILIIAGLLYFCFASLRAVVLPILAMVMAVIATMGLMGWLGFKVSTVTSIIPVLIIALGSSYSIHLLERYLPAIPEQKVKALSLVSMPIMLAGLTSAIGFGSLIVFQIISLREFGVFSALGIIMIIFYNLVFCPALLACLSPQPKDQLGLVWFNRLVDWLLVKIHWLSQKKGLVLVGSFLLLIFAFLGISRLQVGSNPTEFFPPDHPVRLTSELFNEKFNGTGMIEVMFECQEPECIIEPEILQAIWQFQEYASGLESVGYTSSLVDSLRYMNKTLAGSETVPGSLSLVSKYILLYGMDTTVDLDSLIDSRHQRLKVSLWMYIDDSQIIEQNYQQMQTYLQNHLPDNVTAKFGGEHMEWIAQNHYIVTGKIINIIASIVIILLVCSLIWRSWRYGLLTVLPLSFSTLLVFGLMGWLGIRLDLASCILTGVTVGVGVDFAIHYLSRLRENFDSVRDTNDLVKTVNLLAGKPILFDAFSNMSGFIVLVFSGFTPIQDFGWLIVLTMITCSLGTLVFLPILSPRWLKIAKGGN